MGAHDAVTMLGNAAARVLAAPGNTATTQDMSFCKLVYNEVLSATPFKGLTGMVEFSADENHVVRREVALSLLNIDNMGEIHEVAQVLVEKGQANNDDGSDSTKAPASNVAITNSKTHVVTWADGSKSFTRVPSDRT